MEYVRIIICAAAVAAYAVYAMWAARRVLVAQREVTKMRDELATRRECWCSFLELEQPDAEGKLRPIGFQVGRQFGELRARAEHAERQVTHLHDELDDAKRTLATVSDTWD